MEEEKIEYGWPVGVPESTWHWDGHGGAGARLQTRTVFYWLRLSFAYGRLTSVLDSTPHEMTPNQFQGIFD